MPKMRGIRKRAHISSKTKRKVGHAILKYGPGVAAAGLVTGGIALSVATGQPLPLMAGAAAAQGIKAFAADMKEAHRRPTMVHRNHDSGNVSVAPTGSRT